MILRLGKNAHQAEKAEHSAAKEGFPEEGAGQGRYRRWRKPGMRLGAWL